MHKSIMNMRTLFKTETTSLANSFLLLAMVASVLNIDLFECDAVSSYDDHKFLYRIELVFRAKTSDVRPPLLSISEDIPGNNVVKDRVLPFHFYTKGFDNAFVVILNISQDNTRPFYSSLKHTRLFNITHQNSDEDEAFILPVDVA